MDELMDYKCVECLRYDPAEDMWGVCDKGFYRVID